MGIFQRKLMMKLIIFVLATATVVLGAPKDSPSDPRKFVKAPDFVAPAAYRQGTLYAKKNSERLDKRSVIEEIPELLNEFEEAKDQGKVENYKAPAAPPASATYRQGTLYVKKNPERLDKRSVIEEIPE